MIREQQTRAHEPLGLNAESHHATSDVAAACACACVCVSVRRVGSLDFVCGVVTLAKCLAREPRVMVDVMHREK